MKCHALISTGPISNERSRSSHLVRTFNERAKSKGAIMEQEVQLWMDNITTLLVKRTKKVVDLF